MRFFLLLIAAFFFLLKVAAEITPITPENYALAESQIIFSQYKDDIAAATGTDGMGVFMTVTFELDQRTIVRVNYDTIYTFALLDITEPATLVMPETDGRYQSAWLITEEHYNPYAMTEPGRYEITEENTGSKYLLLGMRTLVNINDEEDVVKANDLIDQLEIIQASPGNYDPVEEYDYDEILAMRAYYLKIMQKKSYSSGEVFGAKGTMTQEQHNVGVAYGWGGLTEDQAVYITVFSENTTPGTMTLKDVPIDEKGFWSVTVYDEDSFPKADAPFHVNSLSAVANKDGEYVIHFGGDADADNYVEIYEGWNYTLRLYLPTDRYAQKEWIAPEVVPTN